MDSGAQRPVPDDQRTLRTLDFGLLWFGAAIAITEIWAGGQGKLTSLGLGLGLLAIVLGRIVGNGLMAAMASVGAHTGLPSMVLTRLAFGIRGSYLPALFNLLQLVGWTAWMIFTGVAYLDTLAGLLGLPTVAALPAMRLVWAGLLGGLCLLWAQAFAGQRWWKRLEQVSGVALLLLTVWMSVLVLSVHDLSSLSQRSGSALGLLAGMDLVIAMSVSWLPLVADYSRYARTAGAAAAGTFWGYFIGGTWMYAVGLLVALATGSDTPDGMVIEVLGGQGSAWAVLAIALVLLSTVTTTFLDIYSSVVSAQSLAPRLSVRAGNVVITLIGIALALALDANSYVPFLTAIGAVFLPAFSVVLADWYLLGRGHRAVLLGLEGALAPELSKRGGLFWFSGGVNPRALLAWLIGFAVYDWAGGWPILLQVTGALFHINPATVALPSGASLPCIAASVGVYVLLNIGSVSTAEAQRRRAG